MTARRLLLALSLPALVLLGIASPTAAPPPSRSVTVGLPQAYVPKAPPGAHDDYRCFLLDPKLTEHSFLTGARFRTGPLVHHVILFRIEPSQIASARALDARSKVAGWQCFGGTGVDDIATRGTDALDDAGWVAAWAPTRAQPRLPRGAGVALSRGSRLVMQVHYSVGSTKLRDRTSATLTFVPQAGSSLDPLRTILLPAPVELACLPGETAPLCDRTAALNDLAKRHGAQASLTTVGLLAFCGRDPRAPQATTTMTCDMRFDEPLTIRAAAGHMHLLGKSVTLELNPGTPNARPLLSIPRWDFNDQRIYVLSAPVPVDYTDTLRVTCEHDQRLRRHGEPRYVLWGEGTSDEMCLGVVQVTDR